MNLLIHLLPKSEFDSPKFSSLLAGIGANLTFSPLQGEGEGGDGVDCDRPDK